ncbi:plasmid stabilization protein [Methylococcaceae bacterium CS1]|nr:type II toxin-antitoxin system RelE/ParE family toxin [Methyloprofundus sp.]TXK93211.1 plasmid stabilization protein [Methylococcaceae bacterium CS4]TXK98544.1 plasmid stabilization protein [Methylococcaceae bacterium CS5]TXL02868.1 plasmid stabilization protein [Methylococcaceae bacterium CS3]TXL04354.1 plasmid stabilization protein [Methylococcaceae bacterium CS1]TXL10736.1 plasmid stabilization protein [Methylococcaceae bacterium CS2]
MYRLSVEASTDLDSILDYSFINFGANVTIKYYKSLEKCFDILDDNPDLGIEVEHIRPDYLCLQHRSHLIFYKKIKVGILIVRLLHANMDVSRHFN